MMNRRTRKHQSFPNNEVLFADPICDHSRIPGYYTNLPEWYTRIPDHNSAADADFCINFSSTVRRWAQPLSVPGLNSSQRRLNPIPSPHKMCAETSPLLGSCWGRVITDSRSVRYKTVSGFSARDQWEKSINIAMNSKDYRKVCPSIPEFARFLLVILLMATLPLTSAMSPPPNYSQSNMPTTNFTCSDKATGGYYADPEAGCQMFHVCVRISEDEMNDFRFLCPNDTVFDQQNFICTNWWEIDCERSTRYYSKNDLFRVGDQPPEYEYENSESPVYYEYVYEYVDPEGVSTTTKASTIEKPKTKDSSLEGRHRLSLGKSNDENGEPRVVETASVRSSTHSPKVTKQYRRPATAAVSNEKSHVTLSTTTKHPFFDVSVKRAQVVKAPNHNHNRRGTTPKPTITTITTTTPRPTPKITTHPPLHRLSLIPFSTRPSTPSTEASPLNVRSFNSRGGTALLNKPEIVKPENTQNRDQRKWKEDSGDSFSNFEWKRDSKGVTASARTRYEALFGSTSSRGRDFVRKDDKTLPEALNEGDSPGDEKSSTGNQKRKLTESQIQRRKQRGRKHFGNEEQVQSHKTEQQQNQQNEQKQEHAQNRQNSSRKNQKYRSREPDAPTDDGKHKFSNFRFYKTAFGRSYSSDDFLGNDKRDSPHVKVSDPVRLERTASRNTRYSVYG